MAGTVAYVSVSGLLKVFAGAGVVGLILFSSIEAAKIVATSAIHTYGKKIGWFYNSILSLFIFIAMAITSMGIYGFLSSSYKETFTKFENLEASIELLQKKRDGYQKQLDIINTEKESVSQTITELSKGLSNNVIQYRDKKSGEIITTTSSSTRKALQSQLDRAIDRQEILNTKSDELTDKVFQLDNEITEVKIGDNVASELGPLRYLADVTGMSMDEVMKYFIILLIIIGDPMAVVMVIVFSKVVKSKDDDEPTATKNIQVNPNEDLISEIKKPKHTPEVKKIFEKINKLRKEGKLYTPTEEDLENEPTALAFTPHEEFLEGVDSMDSEEDLTKEFEDTLEYEGEEQLDYDTDVEIEHEDEVIESKPEGKNYVKSIENGVSLNGEKSIKDEEIKKPIERDDIKEIKEEKINRIGTNKEVRGGNTDMIYFKKRNDEKS